jgi:hypothetical protein
LNVGFSLVAPPPCASSPSTTLIPSASGFFGSPSPFIDPYNLRIEHTPFTLNWLKIPALGCRAAAELKREKRRTRCSAQCASIGSGASVTGVPKGSGTAPLATPAPRRGRPSMNSY